MKAIELTGLDGVDSLDVAEVAKPVPGPGELLIEVKAAGINFADLEMAKGRYPAPAPLPYVPGFEAAGVVAALGSRVDSFAPGDRVAALMTGGGYAEYAVADAASVFPIPAGVTYAEAAAIAVQSLTAYALLRRAARPRPGESILIQAAAGGVGLFLVLLAKILGAEKVIALAGSQSKLELVRDLGADAAINYREAGWPGRVLEATGGKGVDLVLEAASGETGAECFRLLAPFGRAVFFGAGNIHDALQPEQMRQLIRGNQSILGFNLPSLPPAGGGRLSARPPEPGRPGQGPPVRAPRVCIARLPRGVRRLRQSRHRGQGRAGPLKQAPTRADDAGN